MERFRDFHPLTAPVESVKDQSLFKGQAVSLAFVIGHPFYYWAWTHWFPQPYESLAWRLVCACLAAAALIAIRAFGAQDPRAGFIYGIATAAGSVVLASWFYVANGSDAVWLASLVALTIIYFSLTDWRIAIGVTLISYAAATVLVPALGIGVWQTAAPEHPFGTRDWLILGFALGVSILSRYTDTSMRVVQMRSQMRALAITAHEIRTPLAGIQLLSTALEDRLEYVANKPSAAEIAAIKELARELRKSCQDANSLINTHLANANPFKPFGQRETVRIAPLAQDVAANFARGVGESVDLVKVNVLRDFVVEADPGALRQILVNLLNNAYKAVMLRHTAGSSHQIAVSVTFDAGGVILISDRGIGIPKSSLARVFDPFFTSDASHGHGLGLTYVKAAVSAYDGTIKIAGNEDGGTAVTIKFSEARLV